eukprot:130640_1
MATARPVQWMIKSTATYKSCTGKMNLRMHRIQCFSNQQKMQSNSSNKKRTRSSFKSYASQHNWQRIIDNNPLIVQIGVPVGVIGFGFLIISISMAELR